MRARLEFKRQEAVAVRVRIEWKVQDCWIGAYWDRCATHTHLWICLLPMLPIHVWWPHMEKPPFPGAAGRREEAGG